MAFGSTQDLRSVKTWMALRELVAKEGSGNACHVATLLRPDVPSRDLVDAVHCLCLLHGQRGMMEAARDRAAHPLVSDWLEQAVVGFAAERAALIALVAHAGLQPSTPGQMASMAALVGQRHALDMLATSDRPGCAVGATMTLLLDWSTMRLVLDAVAHRFGLPLTLSELPSEQHCVGVIAVLGNLSAFERGLLFGARQTLAQHHGLWRLLEARSRARATLGWIAGAR